jgi:hypothetical protein
MTARCPCIATAAATGVDPSVETGLETGVETGVLPLVAAAPRVLFGAPLGACAGAGEPSRNLKVFLVFVPRVDFRSSKNAVYAEAASGVETARTVVSGTVGRTVETVGRTVGTVFIAIRYPTLCRPFSRKAMPKFSHLRAAAS